VERLGYDDRPERPEMGRKIFSRRLHEPSRVNAHRFGASAGVRHHARVPVHSDHLVEQPRQP
jgi:hypothetical protein